MRTIGKRQTPMRRLGRVLMLLGALGVILVPRTGVAAVPEPDRVPPAEAAAVQAALLEMPKIDLSIVYVVRLMVDGRLVEVTSLAPTLLTDDLKGNHWAATVFAYSADKSTLVLFSRDPESGAGYRLTLPVGNVVEGLEFRFPVLRQGRLMVVPIVVSKHVHRP